MPERPFVLLTQDACPKCEVFKRMLAGPLKAFADQIEIVHRQSDPEAFMAYALARDLRAAPALIKKEGAALADLSSLHVVKTFLQS